MNVTHERLDWMASLPLLSWILLKQPQGLAGRGKCITITEVKDLCFIMYRLHSNYPLCRFWLFPEHPGEYILEPLGEILPREGSVGKRVCCV